MASLGHNEFFKWICEKYFQMKTDLVELIILKIHNDMIKTKNESRTFLHKARLRQ